MPSRFLKELPEDEIQRRGGYSSPAAKAMPYTAPRTLSFDYDKRKTAMNSTVSATAKSTPCPDFNKGDMVQHAAFGKGMVLSALKMGSDALLEIAFDRVGTKKLMAKAAAVHMKKL